MLVERGSVLGEIPGKRAPVLCLMQIEARKIGREWEFTSRILPYPNSTVKPHPSLTGIVYRGPSFHRAFVKLSMRAMFRSPEDIRTLWSLGEQLGVV